MGTRKKKHGNLFEDIDCVNHYSRSDTFIHMFHSQMLHPSYMALSSGAKELLLILKDMRRFSLAGREGEYYPNAPKNDPICIYANRARLKLYGWNNPNRFRKCMTELILHGFIRVIELGSTTRTKNIYIFSSKWKDLKDGESIKPEGLNKLFIDGRSGKKDA